MSDLIDTILNVQPFSPEWDTLKAKLTLDKEHADIAYTRLTKGDCTHLDIETITNASTNRLVKALSLIEARENEITQYFGFKL